MIKQDENRERLLKKIKYLSNINQTLNAEVICHEYINLFPKDIYMKIYYAMLLSRNEKYEEAKIILEKILKEKNLDKNIKFFAMSNYAKINNILGNNDVAIEYLNEIINNSYFLELYSRADLSRIYTDLNEYEKAIDILTVEDFNNQFLNNERARVYLTKNEYLKALKEINKEEDLKRIKSQLENIDERVIIQDKNLLLGKIYFNLKNYFLAEKHLRCAMTRKNRNNFWKAYLYLGKVKLKQNEFNDAIRIFDEIIKGPFSDNKIKDKVNKLKIRTYIKKMDFFSASELINNLKDLNEKSLFLIKMEIAKYNFLEAENLIQKITINESTELYVDYLYLKIIIYFRLNKINEFNELYNKFINMERPKIFEYIFEVNLLKLIVDSNNNIEFKKRTNYTYLENQAMKYSKTSALRHIIKHHFTDAYVSYFNNDINVENLFETISNKFSDSLKICDEYQDKYIIDYPNVGYDLDGNICNQLVVICIPNTHNIVTMYPKKGDLIKIEDRKQEKNKTYKRESQIDKFLRKYGNSYKNNN